jgi:hypothetical protein
MIDVTRRPLIEGIQGSTPQPCELSGSPDKASALESLTLSGIRRHRSSLGKRPLRTARRSFDQEDEFRRVVQEWKMPPREWAEPTRGMECHRNDMLKHLSDER